MVDASIAHALSGADAENLDARNRIRGREPQNADEAPSSEDDQADRWATPSR